MHQLVLNAFAPAKINLALHVTGQREDGYHLLDSLVAFANVGDEVDVSSVPNSAPQEFYFALEGDFADDLVLDDKNSIVAASDFFKEASGDLPTGLGICLTKNLPIASGMGGGSADAAATLIAMSKAIGEVDTEILVQMAKTLGADVPMCVHSQTLKASGVGHDIELIDDFPNLHMLLVNPRVQVSTPTVFTNLTEKNHSPLAPLPATLTQDAVIDWLKNQRNDLQNAAIETAPIISKVISSIEESGAQISRMSGSGATCFGIYNSFEECENARLQLFVKHPDWWAVVTQTKDFGSDRVNNTTSSDSWALQS